MSQLNLDDKIEKLKGVGSSYQQKLKRLDIKTVKDLLYHFPYRYNDYSKITKTSDLKPDQTAVVKGKLLGIHNRKAKTSNLMLTEAEVSDEDGKIKVVWFNQPYLKKVLKPNREILLAGEVKLRRGGPVLTNPDYEFEGSENLHIGRIVPVYHQTKGISSKFIRTKVKQVLDDLKIPDFLPGSIKKEKKLIDLEKALCQIHFPQKGSQIKAARERIGFDELFLIILQSKLQRDDLEELSSPEIDFNKKKTKQFIDQLGFNLTNGQKKASWQILKDLKKKSPANRLLNGDVGSGKTVVAAIAAFNTILSGFQVILMAPTEVLAKQHFNTFNDLFADYDIRVDLFTSFEKTANLSKKGEQEIDLVIGTHALLEDEVSLSKPGLIIVDEQHRFGVKQRAKLVQGGEKTKRPNFLTMTATPIPRTLSLAFYGDLNVSFLDEMPQERKPVPTKIISQKSRKMVYKFIKQRMEKGEQVFVICPRIEEDNSNKKSLLDDKKSVLKEYEKLKSKIFPDFNIACLHGKMSSEKKYKVMKKLAQKEYDLLVSTSVIEIGVDIPGATVILIEDAFRFGLAQLHQFRGRVGRSSKQSYCFISPGSTDKQVKDRLKILAQTNDGFKVAREDLKLRGPGELFGKRQHGQIDLKVANFFDKNLVNKAKSAVEKITGKSSNLKHFPEAKKELLNFNRNAHLE